MQDVSSSPSQRLIKVLYEDDFFVAFEKPAGLLVIPTPKKEKNTLIDIVDRQFAAFHDSFRLHPCHRLDRDTSGVILFAKGKRNQQLMMEAFKRRAVKKKYVALVHGAPPIRQGELKSAIRDFDQEKFHKNSFAKTAITRYKVIERRSGFSIVEVAPLTGRTNQIRIQFSDAGFPLVGERKYAFARDFDLRFKRAALHASELEWFHPVLHKPVKITSPIAKDMAEFIAKH